VVTGGSSGLGEAIAKHFAENGARVVITGRDADRGRSVVEAIKADGGDAGFVELDLTDPECGTRLRDAAGEIYGPPEILVNNAGTFFFSPTSAVGPEDFDLAVTINLRGPFLITQALLPGMVENEFGRVVFVASSAASYGVAMTPMYSATKAGLKGLMYALVPEYGSAGVTFNTIEPGLIPTPLTSNLVGTEEQQQPFLPHQPTGRVGVPLDAAHAALMFADDNAGHINGQFIVLDGGNTRTAKHSALPPPPGSSGDLTAA
jgi:NAD(P)-dependent dehydrogenase (short-subunit alcohol dehydrogenase family)